MFLSFFCFWGTVHKWQKHITDTAQDSKEQDMKQASYIARASLDTVLKCMSHIGAVSESMTQDLPYLINNQKYYEHKYIICI